ncbi:MAG: phenylpyruvate tautomerase MIF-related protein [Eubacterium sp.]
MPFIQVKTNQRISSKEELKAELGNAITAIPGKSEGWLMVELQDKLDMYFKGSDEPCAMFEVAIFGKASESAYDNLTRLLCSASEKYLGVSPDRTYVKYSEIDNWGYNNFNF